MSISCSTVYSVSKLMLYLKLLKYEKIYDI